MKDEIAIKVENVSKDFILPHKKRGTLKSFFLNPFSKFENEKQHALSGVSFEVKKGEFFGIVGRNGSGKSTLLKCMAGVYSPDKGRIKVNGSLVPFIELGVGFNPELSGRDNVYLNGALLGFSRPEIDAMYQEIVDFSELEKFMDQKLKNYSSGMQVRLAFSIAIQAKGDILVLDEVLAVGDSAFQQKCVDYFEELKKNNKTVILVTHDMNSVKRYCSKALFLEEGDVKAIGSPDDIANQYTLNNLNKQNKVSGKSDKKLTEFVKKLDIKILSAPSPKSTEKFIFEITYELNKNIEVDLGTSFIYQGQSIIEHNTKELELGHKKNIPYKIKYELPLNQFISKPLRLDVAIFKRDGFELIGYHVNCHTFAVQSESTAKGGLLSSRGKWVQE